MPTWPPATFSAAPDLAGAIRRREASLRGERAHALVLLSMLAELVRPSQAHGHRRPLQPVTGL